MNRCIMTLFVALTALCMSVSGFGAGSVQLQCYNSKIDSIYFSSDTPIRASANLYSEMADACYSVEVVCSGLDVAGAIFVYADQSFDDGWGLQVGYAGTTVDSEGEPIFDVMCGVDDTAIGFLTSGWSVQCTFDKGVFSAQISPANYKFCPPAG